MIRAVMRENVYMDSSFFIRPGCRYIRRASSWASWRLLIWSSQLFRSPLVHFGPPATGSLFHGSVSLLTVFPTSFFADSWSTSMQAQSASVAASSSIRFTTSLRPPADVPVLRLSGRRSLLSQVQKHLDRLEKDATLGHFDRKQQEAFGVLASGRARRRPDLGDVPLDQLVVTLNHLRVNMPGLSAYGQGLPRPRASHLLNNDLARALRKDRVVVEVLAGFGEGMPERLSRHQHPGVELVLEE